MTKKKLKKQITSWWLALSRPPTFRLVKKSQPKKPYKRVTYRTIDFSRKSQILISFRRFRTIKTSRSKKYRQLVIAVYGFRFKEIAVRRQNYRRNYHRASLVSLVSQVQLSLVLVVAGLTGTTYFGYQTVYAHRLRPVVAYSAPKTPKPIEKIVPKGLPRSEPTHLKIPKIAVDTDITTVGLLADGSLATPPVLSNIAGWYKFSPTPGEIGPAIIDGHVDSYKNISVFWRLRELLPDDQIIITRADGSTVDFKVEALQQFSQENFPTNQVYGNIDHPGLRLITCGGTFSRATGHYDQNTVVFASIVK